MTKNIFRWTNLTIVIQNFSQKRPHRWSEFVRKYWTTMIVLIGITVAMTWIERLGWFQHLEGTFYDAFVRGKKPIGIYPNLFIVEITDQDYQDYFDGTSPLKPAVIMDLVAKIQAAGPRVIGVDIDSSDSAIKNRQRWCDVIAPDLKDKALNSNVVWAEVPSVVLVENHEQEPRLELTPVLGGRLQDDSSTGVVRFPIESDWIVRKYRDRYTVAGMLPEPGASCKPNQQKSAKALLKGEMNSLDWVIAKKWRPELAEAPIGDSSYFNFSKDRHSFQILQAHEFLGEDVLSPEQIKLLRDRQAKLLKDKIVLIGGNFGAARDDYMTPVGRMAGVELIATGIRSRLEPGAKPVSEGLRWLFDLIAGSLIVAIYAFNKNRPLLALMISIVAIVLFPMLIGWWFFQSWAVWLNFAPVMFGMWIHQMYESAKTASEDVEKIRKIHELQHPADEAQGSRTA